MVGSDVYETNTENDSRYLLGRGNFFSLSIKELDYGFRKNGVTRFIAGYKFGLNDHALGLVCDDKYAIYDVLQLYQIPVAECFILFSSYQREKVLEYALRYQFDLVVKVNDGTCGNGMYHVTTEEEMFQRIDELLRKSYSISLSPFYKIKNEYRSIVYRDSIEAFYGKKRPVVVGDGVHTVYELLVEFNPNYFSKRKDCEMLDYVLEVGEVYEYGWQHNLSKGAMPFLVEDEDVLGKVQNLALETSKRLGLTFASVDIIELEDGTFKVLEVNSGVMMDNFSQIMEDGERVAKGIYRKAVLDLFEEK